MTTSKPCKLIKPHPFPTIGNLEWDLTLYADRIAFVPLRIYALLIVFPIGRAYSLT